MQYWFYEYCGASYPIVKEDAKFSAYPHLRAWERRKRRKTNDQATNLFILGRYHIDHRTVDTITWEPWLESTVPEIDDVLIAKLLSRKRMPLQVPNRKCKYYLGDRCWRQLAGEVRIPLDPSLNMSPHISPAALQEMRQAGFLDCEQFMVGEERETYTSYWGEQTSEVGHMLIDSQRMGNIDLFRPIALRAGQREMLPIACLRDPPPMSSSYGAEKLWYLTHGMWRFVLIESARDTQRLQELTDELAIPLMQIDSINHQQYAHDLQLRRGCDVRVVQLPPDGSTRTRQRGSGPQTRGGGTSRRGWGTGDDFV
ncbi:hypothetical protein GIB67_020638 [Kingdonia uniflora]|uniref:Uncharacterized protein n=1 Tax=Kingdonia uniflora TaxID=39325 RepID=A0A7J7M9G8_9MAGN|nr:hypothetical protein GIB67_020638 [Kingdonia uniflora]